MGRNKFSCQAPQVELVADGTWSPVLWAPGTGRRTPGNPFIRPGFSPVVKPAPFPWKLMAAEVCAQVCGQRGFKHVLLPSSQPVGFQAQDTSRTPPHLPAPALYSDTVHGAVQSCHGGMPEVYRDRKIEVRCV